MRKFKGVFIENENTISHRKGMKFLEQALSCQVPLNNNREKKEKKGELGYQRLRPKFCISPFFNLCSDYRLIFRRFSESVIENAVRFEGLTPSDSR
jgi:hypothetical protein